MGLFDLHFGPMYATDRHRTDKLTSDVMTFRGTQCTQKRLTWLRLLNPVRHLTTPFVLVTASASRALWCRQSWYSLRPAAASYRAVPDQARLFWRLSGSCGKRSLTAITSCWGSSCTSTWQWRNNVKSDNNDVAVSLMSNLLVLHMQNAGLSYSGPQAASNYEASTITFPAVVPYPCASVGLLRCSLSAF